LAFTKIKNCQHPHTSEKRKTTYQLVRASFREAAGLAQAQSAVRYGNPGSLVRIDQFVIAS